MSAKRNTIDDQRKAEAETEIMEGKCTESARQAYGQGQRGGRE